MVGEHKFIQQPKNDQFVLIPVRGVEVEGMFTGCSGCCALVDGRLLGDCGSTGDASISIHV